MALPRSRRGEVRLAPRIQIPRRPNATIPAEAWIPLNFLLLSPKPTSAATRQTRNKYLVSVFRKEEAIPNVRVCSAMTARTTPMASALNIFRPTRTIISGAANLPVPRARGWLSRSLRYATPIHLHGQAALEVCPAILWGSRDRKPLKIVALE